MPIGQACTNCKHGEYDTDKENVWCSLEQQLVGCSGSCSNWEYDE